MRFCHRVLSGVVALLIALPGITAERVTQGQIVLENVPPVPAELAARTRQYQNTRSAFVQGWLPDGSGVVILTRFGNTSQVHQVRGPGADRRQITFYDEPVSSALVSPDASQRGLLLSKDQGGGEFYQYYWFDPASGRTTLLTDGNSRNQAALWSNRGDRFVYTSTRRNGRDGDLYLAAMAAPTASQRVLDLEGTWYVLDWSPDDQQVLLRNFVSINESSLHVFDFRTQTLALLKGGGGSGDPVSNVDGRWSADGRSLYYVSDAGGEFATLRRLDLETKRETPITAEIPWDVDALAASPDRRWIAFTINDNGRSVLYVLDTTNETTTSHSELPLGVISNLTFSPEGSRVAFTLASPQTPGDVFVLDLSAGSIVRWTESETGGIDASRFAVPTLISFPTFDEIAPGERRHIPAIYYRPSGRPAGEKHPVVINIHGGPESQSVVSFSPLTQFMVGELGAAVIFPNVRGSSGYGKTFLKLDNGMKREDSVKDIGALLDWIEKQPELDSRRVIVMGGSYGGYMTLASMVHYNDRLAGGINVVGISNFVTFLTHTQDYRRDLRRVEYGDERDPEMRRFLESISPLNQVQKITKPMLIAQGYNDPRVPVGEAEQIVAALRRNHVKPWYFLAMDEGHGFRKRSNADAFQNILVHFIETQVIQR